MIRFNGPCDRDCARTTKHSHKPSDPMRGTITHRVRRESITFTSRGGFHSDLVSVKELIARLQQCPPDARVSIEENTLSVINGEQLATVLNAYEEHTEDFNQHHQLTGLSS